MLVGVVTGLAAVVTGQNFESWVGLAGANPEALVDDGVGFPGTESTLPGAATLVEEIARELASSKRTAANSKPIRAKVDKR